MAKCNLLNHKGCDLFKQKVGLLYFIMDYCQYERKSMVFQKNNANDKQKLKGSLVSTNGLRV